MKLKMIVMALILAPMAAFAAGPVPAGDYQCKISKEYKFRPCKVVDDGNASKLVFSGGLFGISATIRAAGKGWIHLEGAMTDKRGYPCTSCQEKCSKNPGSCGCTETPAEGTKECQAQTLGALLKKKGKSWKGVLPYKSYRAEVKNGKPTGKWLIEIERADIIIKR